MQVQQFIRSRERDATTMHVSALVKELEKLADGAASACAYYVRELRHITAVVGMQGSGSATRQAVRDIIIHYGATILPGLCADQQALIRGLRGAKLALDNTYAMAASLAGLHFGKLEQFHASVLTVICEDGFLLLAILVPNDGQEWQCAALRALYGAPPADKPWHATFHAIASLGGPLAKFPRDICTDHLWRDAHLWSNVGLEVVIACLDRDVEILIPSGASAQFCTHLSFACHQWQGDNGDSCWTSSWATSPACNMHVYHKTNEAQLYADDWPDGEDGFCFPVLGKHIENLRPMTREDVDTIDISRLSIVSQDHWHLINRIMKLISKKSPDFALFKADLSKIVAVGSCKDNDPFSATTPAALHVEALSAAQGMRAGLQDLVIKFRWQQCATTVEERRDCAARRIGAGLVQQRAPPATQQAAVERGPDTAPAAIRQFGLPRNDGGAGDDDMFRPRSLAACGNFESVDADEVCTSIASVAHLLEVFAGASYSI